MKNQFKKADKSAAAIAVIVGDDEAEQATASIKVLRRTKKIFDQQTVSQNEVAKAVTNLIESL